MFGKTHLSVVLGFENQCSSTSQNTHHRNQLRFKESFCVPRMSHDETGDIDKFVLTSLSSVVVIFIIATIGFSVVQLFMGPCPPHGTPTQAPERNQSAAQ